MKWQFCVHASIPGNKNCHFQVSRMYPSWIHSSSPFSFSLLPFFIFSFSSSLISFSFHPLSLCQNYSFGILTFTLCHNAVIIPSGSLIEQGNKNGEKVLKREKERRRMEETEEQSDRKREREEGKENWVIFWQVWGQENNDCLWRRGREEGEKGKKKKEKEKRRESESERKGNVK